MRRGLSPAPTTSATVASSRPTAVPCFSTRSATCRWMCRPGCCGSWADGQFYRVGGHQPVQVDVRIIAATHQNLEKRVADGEFREDLFHRLNVIRIHIPALKERREDIPQLARHFLLRAAKELNVEAKSLHPDTQAYISRLPWPGNVRQLENVCRLAYRDGLGARSAGRRPACRAAHPHHPQRRTGPTGDARLLAAAVAGVGGQQAGAGRDRHPGRCHAPVRNGSCWRRRWNTPTATSRRRRACLGWGRNTLTRKLKELDLS